MAAYVRFPSTFWTTLQQRPDEARFRVFEQYRTPIYRYVLNQGFQEHDAQDITQEVFLRVCREEFLKRADREKGKFRTLLLSVARHIMSNRRSRDPRRREVALDGDLPIPAETPPDPQFDGLWIRHLVTVALQRLKEEEAAKGPRYFEALVFCKIQGRPYAEVAEKLGASLSDVKNWVHHGKKKLQAHLTEIVRSYCSSHAEWKEELHAITNHFR